MTALLATFAVGTSALSAIAPASAYEIKSREQAPDRFKNILQDLRAFVGQEGQYLSPETINARRVDLSKLEFKFDHDVKVFFLGETASYRNRLDFQATKGSTVTTGKIFGDTSCNVGDASFTNFSQYCSAPDGALENTVAPNKPLNVGDWVSLGSFSAGTKLDFLLHADDINGGITGTDANGQTVKGIWSLNQALNPDGVQHAISYYYKDYIIIGFEDLWGGGNKDYNDTVFAIHFGDDNARHVTSVPEPTATIALFGIAGLGFLSTRRRRINQVTKVDSEL
ncbi:DUF4114 domain-containing protein [Fortiea contorta]|uniref:DUF4114 domain-containing protein n=1 Tax=Fortiea contorta TaxID=1892405 RepID=UPI001EE647E5|nr:DUF4114 domain-containing protein [Fortiea contorta]